MLVEISRNFTDIGGNFKKISSNLTDIVGNFTSLSWKINEEFKDFMHTFTFAKVFTRGAYDKSHN